MAGAAARASTKANESDRPLAALLLAHSGTGENDPVLGLLYEASSFCEVLRCAVLFDGERHIGPDFDDVAAMLLSLRKRIELAAELHSRAR